MTLIRIPMETRYWGRVIKPRDPQKCWGWRGANVQGYGVLGLTVVVGKCTSVRVSRLSWEIHKGSIPKGFFVLHKCDNPPCTNPRHLFLGTQADNMKDMDKKGRRGDSAHHGEAHPCAKLVEAQVKTILASKEPARVFAKRYRISEALVWAIRQGRIWKHL